MTEERSDKIKSQLHLPQEKPAQARKRLGGRVPRIAPMSKRVLRGLD